MIMFTFLFLIALAICGIVGSIKMDGRWFISMVVFLVLTLVSLMYQVFHENTMVHLGYEIRETKESININKLSVYEILTEEPTFWDVTLSKKERFVKMIDKKDIGLEDK